MKTKTVKATLSMFVAFSPALSSCDKKNASLVNRRTATPKRIEQIKEVQRAKAKEEERLAVMPLKSDSAPEPAQEQDPEQPGQNENTVKEIVTNSAVVVDDDHGARSVHTLAQPQQLLPPIVVLLPILAVLPPTNDGNAGSGVSGSGASSVISSSSSNSSSLSVFLPGNPCISPSSSSSFSSSITSGIASSSSSEPSPSLPLEEGRG
ncbi:hypothetical protein AGMMS49950_07580 [Endomicrobiia bacterium]|nr:hypothetical protein AGMMS49950_07580 [Endomicrobiia bacterium]